MAVSRDDVRNIASLARLAVPAERIDGLVAELNGILAHMDSLNDADTADGGTTADTADTDEGMRLAADSGPSVRLERRPSAFAPEWRDGFFIVPRLETHGSLGAAAEPGEE